MTNLSSVQNKDLKNVQFSTTMNSQNFGIAYNNNVKRMSKNNMSQQDVSYNKPNILNRFRRSDNSDDYEETEDDYHNENSRKILKENEKFASQDDPVINSGIKRFYKQFY